MSFKTIGSAAAHALLEGADSPVYIDVRTEAEFEEGHPVGAVNIPMFQRDQWGRMAPNPDFMGVVEALYDKDATLLLACAMGGRSAQACGAMAAAGWTDLSNVHGGFSGHPGGPGAPPDPGWASQGFAVSKDTTGVSYADVKASAAG